MQDDQTEATIRRVLTEEAAALAEFADHAGAAAEAAHLIHGAAGPLIVTGVGKSGHIGAKIAATFRSLGKPAVFLHAAEASHGDLGLIREGSVALVLSKSGETTELSDVLRFCRDMGVPVVGITAIAGSALARASTVAIVYGDVAEACRNRLAPTTSTTLTLAIGDALAVAVSDLMGTGAEDFRRYHPGGRLGARLMTVGEVMRTGDALPVVAPGAPMAEVVVTMSEKALGIAVLVDAGRIAGIITDGDLRRHAQRLWESAARDIATPDPVTVDPGMLLTEAAEFMSGRKISACLVTDAAGVLAGVLHIHDCIRAGVVA